MNYPVIVTPFLNADGMVLFPFILVKHKKLATNQVLLNHERIHLQQQLELLVLPFYIAYLLLYLVNLLKYKNHHRAYMAIIFEREAYRFENDLAYLRRRKVWAWVRGCGDE